jgi:hypothetical protein
MALKALAKVIPPRSREKKSKIFQIEDEDENNFENFEKLEKKIGAEDYEFLIDSLKEEPYFTTLSPDEM